MDVFISDTGSYYCPTYNVRLSLTTISHKPSQAQMVRRVKAYLKSMKVITDEEELHRMSLEVEPPSGGLPPPPPPAIPSIRKRNPSPSPSAVSSTSSTPSHYSNGEDKRLGQGLAGAPNKFGKSYCEERQER